MDRTLANPNFGRNLFQRDSFFEKLVDNFCGTRLLANAALFAAHVPDDSTVRDSGAQRESYNANRLTKNKFAELHVLR